MRDARFNASDHFAPARHRRRVEPQPVRRTFGGRSSRTGRSLRAYQGRGAPDAAVVQSRSSDRGDDGGDFSAYASPAAMRPCHRAARAVRQQPGQPRGLQPRAVSIAQHLPPRPTVRPDQLQRPARQHDKQYGHARRLPDERGSHGVRPLHRHVRAPAADLVAHGNVLTVRREFGANKRARAQSSAFGDTLVLGANMVNSSA